MKSLIQNLGGAVLSKTEMKQVTGGNMKPGQTTCDCCSGSDCHEVTGECDAPCDGKSCGSGYTLSNCKAV